MSPVRTCVAGLTSTLSKHPALFPENYPIGLIWGEGATVLGTDKKHYTDWIAGLLALILGYNHPAINRAVRRVISDGGPTWSLRHPLEEKVASLLCDLTGYGQVRFVKTGSEACSAAVRIARAVTGRATVISSGYHGWHDSLLITPPAWGQVSQDDVIAIPYGHYLSNAQHTTKKTAAVIVEPVTLEPVDRQWLGHLREWCTNSGALLIFDECITGGRYPGFTAAKHWGVSPDLLVLSKCLANGWPLGAVLGDADVMRCFDLDWKPAWSKAHDDQCGPVYVSGTYSTEIASLAAAEATLTIWFAEGVGNRLWSKGLQLESALRKELATSSAAGVRLKGPPYRLALDTDLETKTRIMASMARQGHLIGAGWNMMAAHTEEAIYKTVEAFRNSLLWLDASAGRCITSAYRQG